MPGGRRARLRAGLDMSDLGSLDDPAPHARLLSNGRYTVLLTGAGTGYSAWNGLALTAWAADRTEDADGVFVYLRDLDRGTIWSVGHQPVGRPLDRDDARYRPGVVQIARHWSRPERGRAAGPRRARAALGHHGQRARPGAVPETHAHARAGRARTVRRGARRGRDARRGGRACTASCGRRRGRARARGGQGARAARPARA